jgi:hypothetical protein
MSRTWLGILHTCQHLGLANSLRCLCPAVDVISYELGPLRNSPQKAEVADRLLACDHLISCWVPGDYDVLSTAALSPKHSSFHLVPSFTFNGFHPDTIYVQSGGKQVQVITGPYNSLLTLACYLCDLSVDETTDLFNALVYSRLGYFDAFNAARNEVILVYQTYGIDISDNFDNWMNGDAFMYTPNHPNTRVLWDIAHAVARNIGLEIESPELWTMVPDYLSLSHRLPVYPEIARRLRISGAYWFRPLVGGVDRSVRIHSLKEFVSASFETYTKVPRNDLLGASGVKEAISAINA